MTTIRKQHSLGAPYLLLFLFGILLLAISLGAAAKGLRLEAAIGNTHYGLAGDNIWFDQTYAHDNRLSATGGIVGVSGDFNRRFGWRVWFAHFGDPTSTAVFPPDADYFAHDGAPAKYQARGHGFADALTFGPTVTLRPWQRLRLTLEAGAAAYRARWSEEMRQIGSIVWENCAAFSAVGITRYGWTMYDGIGLRSGHVFLSYRRYRDIYAKDAVFGNALTQTVVGMRFGF